MKQSILVTVERVCFDKNYEGIFEIMIAILEVPNFVFKSENFYLKWNSKGAFNCANRGLFMGIDKNELAQDTKLYLVFKIFRKNGFFELKENGNKKLTRNIKKLLAVSAFDLSDYINGLVPCNQLTHHFIPFLLLCDRDNPDSIIRKAITSREINHKGQGLWISFDIVETGSISDDKIQTTTSKVESMSSITQIQKLGYSDIIIPTDYRNDLYLTIVQGEFIRAMGNDKNIQVTVTVHDTSGKLVTDVMTIGATCRADFLEKYTSAVYYHEDNPKWAENLKLTIPLDKVEEYHVRFTYKHRCTLEAKDKYEKPFGISFMKLVESPTLVKDGLHTLLIYKTDDKRFDENRAEYLGLPHAHFQLQLENTEQLQPQTVVANSKLTPPPHPPQGSSRFNNNTNSNALPITPYNSKNYSLSWKRYRAARGESSTKHNNYSTKTSPFGSIISFDYRDDMNNLTVADNSVEDNEDTNLIPNKNGFWNALKASDKHGLYLVDRRDYLHVQTLFCSTKLTQNEEILKLLAWKTYPEKRLRIILRSFLNINGDEIVKFLPDTLDAIFGILSRNNQKSTVKSHSYDTITILSNDKKSAAEYEQTINNKMENNETSDTINEFSSELDELDVLAFEDLLVILNLLTQRKYINFKSTLDTYIEETFSYTLVHRKLLKLLVMYFQSAFSNLVNNNDNDCSSSKAAAAFSSSPSILHSSMNCNGTRVLLNRFLSVDKALLEGDQGGSNSNSNLGTITHDRLLKVAKCLNYLTTFSLRSYLLYLTIRPLTTAVREGDRDLNSSRGAIENPTCYDGEDEEEYEKFKKDAVLLIQVMGLFMKLGYQGQNDVNHHHDDGADDRHLTNAKALLIQASILKYLPEALTSLYRIFTTYDRLHHRHEKHDHKEEEKRLLMPWLDALSIMPFDVLRRQRIEFWNYLCSTILHLQVVVGDNSADPGSTAGGGKDGITAATVENLEIIEFVLRVEILPLIIHALEHGKNDNATIVKDGDLLAKLIENALQLISYPPTFPSSSLSFDSSKNHHVVASTFDFLPTPYDLLYNTLFPGSSSHSSTVLLEYSEWPWYKIFKGIIHRVILNETCLKESENYELFRIYGRLLYKLLDLLNHPPYTVERGEGLDFIGSCFKAVASRDENTCNIFNLKDALSMFLHTLLLVLNEPSIHQLASAVNGKGDITDGDGRVMDAINRITMETLGTVHRLIRAHFTQIPALSDRFNENEHVIGLDWSGVTCHVVGEDDSSLLLDESFIQDTLFNVLYKEAWDTFFHTVLSVIVNVYFGQIMVVKPATVGSCDTTPALSALIHFASNLFVKVWIDIPDPYLPYFITDYSLLESLLKVCIFVPVPEVREPLLRLLYLVLGTIYAKRRHHHSINFHYVQSFLLPPPSPSQDDHHPKNSPQTAPRNSNSHIRGVNQRRHRPLDSFDGDDGNQCNSIGSAPGGGIYLDRKFKNIFYEIIERVFEEEITASSSQLLRQQTEAEEKFNFSNIAGANGFTLNYLPTPSPPSYPDFVDCLRSFKTDLNHVLTDALQKDRHNHYHTEDKPKSIGTIVPPPTARALFLHETQDHLDAHDFQIYVKNYAGDGNFIPVFLDTVNRIIELMLEYYVCCYVPLVDTGTGTKNFSSPEYAMGVVQEVTTHTHRFCYEAQTKCLLDLVEFNEEINRHRAHSKFTDKLIELHVAQENFAEAGLTLKHKADMYPWTHDTDEESKIGIYTRVVDYLIKSKLWEPGIQLCNEILNFYGDSNAFEYARVSYWHKILSTLYDSVLTQTRPEIEYYRVAFIGNGFSSHSFKNTCYIYRGRPFERLIEFSNRILASWEGAKLLTNSDLAIAPDHLHSNDKYIQISKVTPINRKINAFELNLISDQISNFFKLNNVQEFEYTRPIINKKQQSVKGNVNGNGILTSSSSNKSKNSSSITDFGDIWVEKTYFLTSHSFPGILTFYPIIHSHSIMLSPLENAIETMNETNQKLKGAIKQHLLVNQIHLPNAVGQPLPNGFLINDSCVDSSVTEIRTKTRPGSNSFNHAAQSQVTNNCNSVGVGTDINSLSLLLNGIVDPAVMGGIANYEKAFLNNSEYLDEHPEDSERIKTLKKLILAQVPLLEMGIVIHGIKCHESLKLFQQRMEECLLRNKQHINEKYSGIEIPEDYIVSELRYLLLKTYATPNSPHATTATPPLAAINMASHQNKPNFTCSTKVLSSSTSKNNTKITSCKLINDARNKYRYGSSLIKTCHGNNVNLASAAAVSTKFRRPFSPNNTHSKSSEVENGTTNKSVTSLLGSSRKSEILQHHQPQLNSNSSSLLRKFGKRVTNSFPDPFLQHQPQSHRSNTPAGDPITGPPSLSTHKSLNVISPVTLTSPPCSYSFSSQLDLLRNNNHHIHNQSLISQPAPAAPNFSSQNFMTLNRIKIKSKKILQITTSRISGDLNTSTNSNPVTRNKLANHPKYNKDNNHVITAVNKSSLHLQPKNSFNNEGFDKMIDIQPRLEGYHHHEFLSPENSLTTNKTAEWYDDEGGTCLNNGRPSNKDTIICEEKDIITMRRSDSNPYEAHKATKIHSSPTTASPFEYPIEEVSIRKPYYSNPPITSQENANSLSSGCDTKINGIEVLADTKPLIEPFCSNPDTSNFEIIKVDDKISSNSLLDDFNELQRNLEDVLMSNSKFVSHVNGDSSYQQILNYPEESYEIHQELLKGTTSAELDSLEISVSKLKKLFE